MKRTLSAALGALAMSAALACGAWAAQTLPENLEVSIEIVAACTVDSVSNVSFGTQGTLTGANWDATGEVEVTCPDEIPYSIALDAGQGDAATTSIRKMTGPSDATIDYTLYSNAGRTTVWGDTVGTDAVAGTGTGEAQVHTIYARVPTQTTPAIGSYSDTVTIVVHY